MKVRSKKMWEYLSQAGVLESPEELIMQAKFDYRRLYKRTWKKNIKKCKELRPTFTKIEFDGILERAKLYGLHPTTYARDLILSNQSDISLIPKKSELQGILQAISMAENALSKDKDSAEANELLLKAESMLLTYLNISE